MKKIYDSPTKTIPLNDFIEMTGEKQWKNYLKNNVFAYHPTKGIVTFQSKVMENYVREQLIK